MGANAIRAEYKDYGFNLGKLLSAKIEVYLSDSSEYAYETTDEGEDDYFDIYLTDLFSFRVGDTLLPFEIRSKLISAEYGGTFRPSTYVLGFEEQVKSATLFVDLGKLNESTEIGFSFVGPNEHVTAGDDLYWHPESLFTPKPYAYGYVEYSFAEAVPEPATWAMMMVGFGLAGAALRSNRKRTLSAI